MLKFTYGDALHNLLGIAVYIKVTISGQSLVGIFEVTVNKVKVWERSKVAQGLLQIHVQDYIEGSHL